MGIKKIVIQHLKDNGYGGLRNPELECSCDIGDLWPCDNPDDDCEPCYIVKANCETCENKCEYASETERCATSIKPISKGESPDSADATDNTGMLSASQIVEDLMSIKEWLESGRKIAEGDRVGALLELNGLIQQLQHA